MPITTRVSYGGVGEIIKYEADSRVLGIPIYHVSKFIKKSLDITKFGLWWCGYEADRDIELYTRWRIGAWVVRFYYFTQSHIYWAFLRMMRRLGFITIQEGERFSWRQHFFVIPRG